MPMKSSTTMNSKSSLHALWGFVAAWLGYSTSPAKEAAARSALGVQTFTFRPRISTIDTPLMVMEGESATVIGLGGTDNIYQWLSYIQLHDQITHADLNGKIFEPFVTGANSVISRLPNDIFAGRKNLIFAGHSYGGAVAEIVAKILTRRGVAGGVRAVTFGKPKCGDPEFASWRTISQDDYVNRGDPVPSLPPDSLTLYDPVGGFLQLLQFRPSGPVTYLDEGGFQRDGPVEPIVGLIGFLGRAILDPQSVVGTVPHPMSAYRERLLPIFRLVSPEAASAITSLVNDGFFQ